MTPHGSISTSTQCKYSLLHLSYGTSVSKPLLAVHLRLVPQSPFLAIFTLSSHTQVTSYYVSIEKPFLQYCYPYLNIFLISMLRPIMLQFTTIHNFGPYLNIMWNIIRFDFLLNLYTLLIPQSISVYNKLNFLFNT
jgi:hypothetical protein